jgi:hypothetical protein
MRDKDMEGAVKDGETYERSGKWKKKTLPKRVQRIVHTVYCTILYCTPLYCTVVYCSILHCTVPGFDYGQLSIYLHSQVGQVRSID